MVAGKHHLAPIDHTPFELTPVFDEEPSKSTATPEYCHPKMLLLVGAFCPLLRHGGVIPPPLRMYLLLGFSNSRGLRARFPKGRLSIPRGLTGGPGGAGSRLPCPRRDVVQGRRSPHRGTSPPGSGSRCPRIPNPRRTGGAKTANFWLEPPPPPPPLRSGVPPPMFFSSCLTNLPCQIAARLSVPWSLAPPGKGHPARFPERRSSRRRCPPPRCSTVWASRMWGPDWR